MTHVLVRYRVKPDRAAENEELVRAVYDELHAAQPDGLRYATFQLDDGVTFVHLASGGGGTLTELQSFKRFQENIAERCDEPPAVSELREIGSYRYAGAPTAAGFRASSSITPATNSGRSSGAQ